MATEQSKLLQRFSKDLYLERIFPGLKEEKARQYAILAFTLFAICFFAVFAIAPTLTTILNLQKQLEDNKFVDFQLQQKISALSTLEQKYAAIQDTLPAIYAAIPQTPQAPLLFGELQALANQNQIKIAHIETNMPLAPLDAKESDQPFDIAFELTGQKDALFAFMNNLTKLDRIITIEGITVGKDDSKEQAVSALDMRLSIKAKGHMQITQL